MTIEEENQELKDRIIKLEEWIKFYQENETRRMWMESAESSPLRNFEINREYRRSLLPKI